MKAVSEDASPAKSIGISTSLFKNLSGLIGSSQEETKATNMINTFKQIAKRSEDKICFRCGLGDTLDDFHMTIDGNLLIYDREFSRLILWSLVGKKTVLESEELEGEVTKVFASNDNKSYYAGFSDGRVQRFGSTDLKEH
jgi:hypothetical protein